MSGICTHCRSRVEAGVTICPHDGKKVIANLTGQVIAARYEIRDLLGIGGMEGSVWRAIQQSNEREVAVKLLPPGEATNDPRFERGAKIASALNHPNITTIHDYGREADGTLYLVMELLQGDTLQSLLHRGENLSPLRTAQIVEQVLRGLEHAHRNHVIHRDLKPGNLFLTSKNEDAFLKIVDFGIAKHTEEITEEKQTDLTGQQHICGTPQYMAPEQILLDKIDCRTDLYSLGVVMYRMLTGRLPFPSSKTSDLLRHHVHSLPPRFSEIRPDLSIPERFEEIVMRALEKSPEDRFQTAREMRTALREARHGLGLFFEEEASMSLSMSASVSMVAPAAMRPARGGGLPTHALFGVLGLLAFALLVGVFIGSGGLEDGAPSPTPGIKAQGALGGAMKGSASARADAEVEEALDAELKPRAEAQPDAETPTTEEAQPKAEEAQPKAEEAQPKAEEAQPKRIKASPPRARSSQQRRASKKQPAREVAASPVAAPPVATQPAKPAKPAKPVIGLIGDDKPTIGLID
ncbi:protein kinase [Myxococcota bacterium]|nr:protein kinase [Myxococcota bacterium]